MKAAAMPPASIGSRKKKTVRCLRENIHGQKRGDVSTNRHKTGMADGKFAHVAVNQIQADRENDVDSHVNQN